MSYTIDISLALGTSKTGLTLNATLIDSNATSIPGQIGINTGFNEIGNGNYLWHYTNFPDGFRGGIKFFSVADTTIILAFLSINPEDYEDISKIYKAQGNTSIEMIVSNEKDTVEVDTGVSSDNIQVIPGVE
jgi:hypothetical protein